MIGAVTAPVLCAIQVAADPSAWVGAGFSVAGNKLAVGEVTIELGGRSNELVWDIGEHSAAPTAHPNGVTEIDHVVVLTPQLEPTIAELEQQGMQLKRTREGETGMGTFRQAFFRVGQPILEVVEAADMHDDEPARFWGITFTTADVDGAAELLGDKLGRVKDAVQAGRRIATVRREAGLGLPVALISPKP
jgi:hypothetical protein